MDKKEKEELISFIEWEGGLEAAFVSYGYRTDDTDLSYLITKFVEAYKDLEQYIYND